MASFLKRLLDVFKLIYKNVLRKKIQNIITDLYDNRLKSYNVKNCLNSPKYWIKYLQREDEFGYSIAPKRFKKVDNILKMHNASYLGEGMSRIGFEINHNNQLFVFKLCMESCSELCTNNNCIKNENEKEFNNIKKASSYEYIKPLILPVIDYFEDRYAKHVIVMPKIHVGLNHDQHKYNSFRERIINSLSEDAHIGNVGYWKGLHWIFDLNFYNTDYDIEKTNKRHKKYISTSKIKGTKNRFKKAKKLIKEFGLELKKV